MPARIDDKTTIPLIWVIGLMMGGIASTVTGTFWVSTVNARLSRIEAKLGIPKIDNGAFPTAQAQEIDRAK